MEGWSLPYAADALWPYLHANWTPPCGPKQLFFSRFWYCLLFRRILTACLPFTFFACAARWYVPYVWCCGSECDPNIGLLIQLWIRRELLGRAAIQVPLLTPSGAELPRPRAVQMQLSHTIPRWRRPNTRRQQRFESSFALPLKMLSGGLTGLREDHVNMQVHAHRNKHTRMSCMHMAR